MTEEMTPEPEDPYGVSKYAVELDLRAAHEMFGLDYVVFRPHNVYGENQNIGDKYRNVIGIFMNQIMQGKKLTVFGDGTQTRAFSYIDDVAIPLPNV
jgi:UDP-glucose 4-epimerase